MKKLSPFVFSFVFMTLFGLLMAQSNPVFAASITVDTFDHFAVDDGNCSLSEAIMAANLDTAVDQCTAGSGADIINLSEGVYDIYFELDYTDGPNAYPSITSPITIMGNGSTLIRSAEKSEEGGVFRFFHVAETGHLTINNLTLENGCVEYGYGDSGGAIFNRGALNVENQSQFIANHADYLGGAIYNKGTATIDNSFVGESGEYPYLNYAYNGGGIYNEYDALLTIKNNSQIIGNHATYAGGGIYNDGSLNVESGSIIAENVVYGEEGEGEPITPQNINVDFEYGYLQGFGGGIYNTMDVNISDATIRNNEAPTGGGLANSYSDADASIESTTIHNNKATQGGGIYSDYASEEITNSTISGNVAYDDGGGIFSYGSYTTLYFVTITENVADDNGDYYGIGGGIYASYSTVEMTNSILANNDVNNLEPFAFDCYDDGGMGEGEGEGEGYENAFSYVAYSLIGNNDGCQSIVDGENGNIIGSSEEPVNAGLTPLGEFGGPNLTHSLILGSIAIDAGSENCVVTDQRGFDRPVDGNNDGGSVCDMGAVEVGFLNDAWPRAKRIDLNEDLEGLMTGQIDTDSVDILGQSRWYKFTVDPESDITVDLTNLAANYDITLYKDIAQEYAELVTVENEEQLIELTAEFAPDAYSPDIFSPDIFSPDIFSPDIFSPDIFSPDIFSPDIFSPDIFSPDIFSPDIFSP
ncbi:MAG: choice-of-anchor Q domain-containing protein, partial [Chloroflexota bacterium]